MRIFFSACVLFACSGIAFVTVTKAEVPDTFSPQIPGNGIRWLGDLGPAAEKAAQSERPLLIYITTDNCVFCRKMERQTWAEKAVVERVNHDYIALKLDAKQNRELVKRFNIRGYPTTLLVQIKNKKAFKLEGFFDAEKLLKNLAQHAPEDSLFLSSGNQQQ